METEQLTSGASNRIIPVFKNLHRSISIHRLLTFIQSFFLWFVFILRRYRRQSPPLSPSSSPSKRKFYFRRREIEDDSIKRRALADGIQMLTSSKPLSAVATWTFYGTGKNALFCRSWIPVAGEISVYWAAVFQIPKAVIKDIERILKRFLWCGGELKKGSAKVAWKLICRPKKEGGLGLRSLGEWNDAMLMKNLWNIVSNKNSMWVRWVNRVKLKGTSIWEISKESSDSWMWKVLLDLRSKMRDSIVKDIGNGENINVWYDNWHTNGILGEFIPLSVIHGARLHEKMTIKDMIVEQKWNWPVGWVEQFQILKGIEVPNLEANKMDRTKWRRRDGSLTEFSTKEAYQLISSTHPTVKWYKVVWFSQCSPRQAFILWMAILGKLQTQDRMMKWQKNVILKCPLCRDVHDSHDHLFFECKYSKVIWAHLKAKLDLKWMHHSWLETVDQIAKGPCNNSIKSIVCRIGLASAVYHIWKERNGRLFTGKEMDSKSLWKIIVEDIRMQMACLKVKNSANVQRMALQWNVDLV